MIWQRFLEVAAQHADSPAVIGDDETLTFSQFVSKVREEAETLAARSVERSPARVLVLPTEPVSLLVRIFACWSVGMVPVILRDGQSSASLEKISEAVDPVAVLPDDAVARFSHKVEELATFGSRDEALVICTSGTTGTPKLVALPAEGVLATAGAIALDLGFSEGDLIAVPTPLAYMYGLMGGAVSGLFSGAAVRLFVPGKPITEVQAAIRREGITVVQGPPTLMSVFLAYWTGKPFASVRLVTTGGEYVAPEIADRIKEAFPQSDFRLIYGMTEAGPRISHTNTVLYRGNGLVVGRPFDHIDWRIEPLHDEGFSAGIGRLSLRGPNICLGYIQSGNEYAGVDSEGFFLSSDLVSEIDGSQLCFHGRYDRLFKTQGKLINPLEVENVLLMHPDVRYAVCRPEKHRLKGLVPVAEVVMESSATCLLSDLEAHCSVLEPHAIPHRIEIREDIEVAASGKRLLI